MNLVQCGTKECGAYGFCSHAKSHKERINCYNDKPEERVSKGSTSKIVCPKCQIIQRSK